jgi:hypothetical protein
VLIALRVVAFLAGAYIVVGTCLSAVKTVVVPRATVSGINRIMFVLIRRLFEAAAHERRAFADRDRIMALYAPITLVLLPGLWVFLVVVGFTAMHWGLEGNTVREAYLISGSSMLTLGNVFRGALPSATLSFIEATLGLGLVALLISYLPSIYGSFSRREATVTMLEVRAGTPPSPYELLVRYARIGMLDDLDSELFPKWEQWFVEVEESHTSIGALSFFRSPHPSRSWITAAGCVLDTASIYLSVVDLPRSPRAAICIRTGFITLRSIADYFHLPYDPDPTSDDPISVSRREFDLMCVELEAAGVPLKANRDQAWIDFVGWRVNYDQPLVLIAKLVIAPEGRWSSDRPGPRMTPRLSGRRARKQMASGRVLES